MWTILQTDSEGTGGDNREISPPPPPTPPPPPSTLLLLLSLLLLLLLPSWKRECKVMVATVVVNTYTHYTICAIYMYITHNNGIIPVLCFKIICSNAIHDVYLYIYIYYAHIYIYTFVCVVYTHICTHII